MSIESLDPVYFRQASWTDRLNDWLRERAPDYDAFYHANESHISNSILNDKSVLRMVVNIPANALLSFLSAGSYENTYERNDVVAGNAMGRIHPRRQRVDEALFPGEAHKYYYGAVALGGCGVRFYGEYCMALNVGSIDSSTRVMDRNSWDIDFEPLSDYSPGTVIERLTGVWQGDLVPIVKLKVLPLLSDILRLTTTGTVADAVLHDESFIEVHRRGTFGPPDIYEVRESATGATIEGELDRKSRDGSSLTLEEHIWRLRRQLVRDALDQADLRLRIVETSGRTR